MYILNQGKAMRSFSGGLKIMFVLFALTGAAGANWIGVYDPLRVVEREHFRFIYQEPLEAKLPEIIKSFEDAYAVLSPVFKTVPRQKITVLFDDSWDEHNGFATIFPRPTVAVYAADVSPGSSIYEPGDFWRGTAFHEMAHVLPMNAQYGLGDFLTRIFGRLQPLGDPLSTVLGLLAIPPNTLAPTWYLEGLSIWAETEFVGPGRGRGSVADMIMRMAAVENRLLYPVQWELELPEHPFGEAAYLYGMRTVQYVHETVGLERDENTPGDLADSVAHSLLFFFNSRAIPVTGQSFEQLTYAAMKRERERQQDRVNRLNELPVHVYPPLTPERMQARHPVFGPDGRSVYFIGSVEAERDTLYRYDIDTQRVTKQKAARVQEGISRLSASADGRHIYYTRLNYRGRDRLWNELLAYDTQADRVRRITAHGRYRYPAVSPDGLRLAAVRNAAGERVLLEVPLASAGETAAERSLAVAPPRRQIVDPVYTPDGKALLYVLSGQGTSQIRRVMLPDGPDERLVEMSGLIISPAVHPSGAYMVFSSDLNGVFNVYRMPVEPGVVPVPFTHVLGGAFSPAFSPDGQRLAFSVYDASGYRLALLDTASVPPAVADALPDIREGRWTTLPANQQRVRELEKQPVPDGLDSRPYRSVAEVRPDFWTPWLAASEDGVMSGVAVSLSDPVMINSIFLSGGYDSGLEVPLASASWTYAGWEPVITFYGNHDADRYDDLIVDERGAYRDYSEKVAAGGVALEWPFPDVDQSLSLSLGYHYADRSITDKACDDLAGVSRAADAPLLYEGGAGSLWVAAEWFTASAFPRSASLEDGRVVSVAFEYTDPALGGDLSRTRSLAQWNEYITLPWRENHVLKLHALGGTGSGDEIAQGFFGLGGIDYAMTGYAPAIPRNIGLRGYPENYRTGRNVVMAGGSYRFPLYHIYQAGSPTMPVYMQQLFGEVFYEGGMVWDQSDDRPWLGSVGVEINLSTTLLRMLEVAPGMGIAYAFDREARLRPDGEEEGVDKLQFYLSIKASVNF